MKPGHKNVDIKVIVLSKDATKRELKNKDTLYRCVITDNTARIDCNLFGEIGESVKPGDILYIIGAYVGIFNFRMVLY